MPSLETTGDRPIPPDTKDWTWVLERRCPECGFDAAAVAVADVPDLVRDSAMALAGALLRSDATTRPDATTWSVLEYACHVRDVHRLFGERLMLMLTEDEPRFPNWDQDETAVSERYSEQDPAVVAAELVEEAAATAGRFARVTPDQHGRRGVRSNGSVFTVESLGRYYVHDLVHHVHDVGAGA